MKAMRLFIVFPSRVVQPAKVGSDQAFEGKELVEKAVSPVYRLSFLET